MTRDKLNLLLQFNRYVLILIKNINNIRDLYLLLIFLGQYILYLYPRQCGTDKFETGATSVSDYDEEDIDVMDCLANIVRIRNHIIHYDKVKLYKDIEDVKQGTKYLMSNYTDEFIKNKIHLLIDYGFDNIKRDCCEIEFEEFNSEEKKDSEDIDVAKLLDIVD